MVLFFSEVQRKSAINGILLQAALIVAFRIFTYIFTCNSLKRFRFAIPAEASPAWPVLSVGLGRAPSLIWLAAARGTSSRSGSLRQPYGVEPLTGPEGPAPASWIPPGCQERFASLKRTPNLHAADSFQTTPKSMISPKPGNATSAKNPKTKSNMGKYKENTSQYHHFAENWQNKLAKWKTLKLQSFFKVFVNNYCNKSCKMRKPHKL